MRLLFIGVTPLLFLQLPLRTVTEPYPAILMPAGASLLRADGSYSATQRDYFAEAADGRQARFALDSLLHTVPTHYHAHILETGLGLNQDRVIRRVPVPFARNRLELGHALTASQFEETRSWLRGRLEEMTGFEPVRIRIVANRIVTHFDERPVRRDLTGSEETIVELRETTP